MEAWDILDSKGKATGKTVHRNGSIKLNNGEYHLVVHIWLRTPDGRIIIQRRADDKDLMPGEWAAIGGAAVSGEESRDAARRELCEEMGINENDGRMTYIKRLIRKNSFVDIWIADVNVIPENLKLQESEVAEVKWTTISEFTKMIQNGTFHNYGSDYFETVLNALKSTKLKGKT